MDLDLPLARTVGRSASPVSAEVVRELTAVDLTLLGLDRGVKAPTLKRLRDSHHSIARLMAQGLRNTDIAAITGYSQSRLSILKADPAFEELISFYKSNVDEIKDAAFAGVQEKLAAVNHEAIEELHERLLDAPEAINTDQLLDVIKATSDRTGHGPQTKSTNVNVNIDLAARVAAGRARVGAGAAPNPGELASPATAPMKVVEGSVLKPSTTDSEAEAIRKGGGGT